MKQLLRRLIADDVAQDLAEYGIALAVIAVAVVAAAGVIAGDVNTLWTTASANIGIVAGN